MCVCVCVRALVWPTCSLSLSVVILVSVPRQGWGERRWDVVIVTVSRLIGRAVALSDPVEGESGRKGERQR